MKIHKPECVKKHIKKHGYVLSKDECLIDECICENNKELVIYTITKDGEGRVKEYKRIPLEELYYATLDIPIRLFREDVVLNITIEEKETQ